MLARRSARLHEFGHRFCSGNPLVGFVSDVEGSLGFFDNFCSISQILYRNDRGALDFRRPLVDRFVFGGDCFDHGVGDLRIAHLMVDLKKRYPDHVVLLLGNRDINKMKLTSELHPTELDRSPENVPRPYFIPSQSPHVVSFVKYLEQHNVPSNLHRAAATRLKWLFNHTMGCSPTFEHRRAELAAMRQVISDVSVISDDDVVESFLRALSPGGCVAEYLSHGQVAAIIGDTMFVHGAVNKHCVGFVPAADIAERPYYHEEDLGAYSGYTEDERSAIGFIATPGHDIIRHDGASLTDWVAEMQRFSEAAVREWLDQPTFDSPALPNPVAGGGVWGRRRGGSALIAYPHRATMGKKTCVVQTFLRQGSLTNVDLGTVACLNACGVSRVIVGHQPAGETPSFITQPGLQVVCADNSYCAAKTPTTRGLAANEVLVDTTTSDIRCHGTLSDGTPFDFVVAEGDEIIGRRDALGWWSKAYDASRSKVLMQRTKNAFYNVEYEWIAVDDARKRLHDVVSPGSCGGSIDWGIRREDLKVPPSCGSRGSLPNTRLKTQVRGTAD